MSCVTYVQYVCTHVYKNMYVCVQWNRPSQPGSSESLVLTSMSIRHIRTYVRVCTDSRDETIYQYINIILLLQYSVLQYGAMILVNTYIVAQYIAIILAL